MFGHQGPQQAYPQAPLVAAGQPTLPGAPGKGAHGTEQKIVLVSTADPKLNNWRTDAVDKVTREQLKHLQERLAKVSEEHKVLYDKVQASTNPEGVIKVQVIRATNLKAADPNGLSDPYVVMRFEPVNKAGRLASMIGAPEILAGQLVQEKKTEVVEKNLNPSFKDVVYEFGVEIKHFMDADGRPLITNQGPNSPIPGPELTLRVMDEDKFAFKDDFLGMARIKWDRLTTEFSQPGSRVILDITKEKWEGNDPVGGGGLLEVHINYERKVPVTAESFQDSQRLQRVATEMRHLTNAVNKKTAKMIELCTARFELARADLTFYSAKRTELFKRQQQLAMASNSATAVHGTLSVTPIRCEGLRSGNPIFGTADVYLCFRLNNGNRMTVPSYEEYQDEKCLCFGETPVFSMPATKVVIFDDRVLNDPKVMKGDARPWPYRIKVTHPAAYIVVDIFHSISATPRTVVPLVNKCLGRVHIPVLDILHLPPGERTFQLEADTVDNLFGSAATGTVALKFEFHPEPSSEAMKDPIQKELDEEDARIDLDVMKSEIEYVTNQMTHMEKDMKLFDQLRLYFDATTKNNLLASTGSANPAARAPTTTS
eukprot:tig00020875_g14886.t1